MASKLTMKTVGATLRRLRHARGWTTTQVAEKVGRAQPQISRLETGKQGLRFDTLLAFAKVFRVPPFRLLMTDAEWALYSR